jgi:uncharacterized protein Smg (DUF494 family)
MEVPMDERMMSIFSLIAEQARDRKDLFDHEGAIMQSLMNSGVRPDEADTALSLMQSLAQGQDGGPRTGTACGSCLRAMTRQERARFSTEAFGFVSRMVRLGVITGDQREDIMERAMSVYTGRIEHDHIKAIVALALFTGELDADSTTRPARLTGVSWN